MRRLLPLALLALLSLTLLPGLAAVDALDEREARDAITAIESTQGREWLTPIYGHDAFFEKPLAGYAPEVLARRALHRAGPVPDGNRGVATSRAVRAVLAGAIALVVAGIGQRMFGARSGWLAACALASMLGLPLAARADGVQLVGTLLAWLGIGAWLDVLTGRKHSRGVRAAVGWIALGGAFVTAGPLPALWPVAGLAWYFALARNRSGWSALDPWAGVLLIAGIGLPWYGLMLAIHDGAFLPHVLWFPYASGTRAAWFATAPLALSFAVVTTFPWTPLFAAALADAALRLRRAGSRRPSAPPAALDVEHVEHLLLTLALAATLPMALYPGPPLTAALPVLPAVALLVGRFADRVLDGASEPRALTQATRLLAAFGTTFALAGVVLAQRLPEAATSVRQLAAALFLASWAPLLADLRGARRLALALFALPAAIGAPLLLVRVLPPLEPWLNARAVASVMQRSSPPLAPLVVWEPPPPSLRDALRRNFLSPSQVGPDAEDARASDGFVYAAWPPSRERAALAGAAAFGGPPQVLTRTPVLVLARFGRSGTP
jgi:4-amino-4-deoxy-L-arabinose transferase-like glycosyltransferase